MNAVVLRDGMATRIPASSIACYRTQGFAKLERSGVLLRNDTMSSLLLHLIMLGRLGRGDQHTVVVATPPLLRVRTSAKISRVVLKCERVRIINTPAGVG